jgi:hypothetical protein
MATNFGKRPVKVEIRIRVIFTSRGVSETPLAERPANAAAPARKSRLFKIMPPTRCTRRTMIPIGSKRRRDVLTMDSAA